MLRHTIRITLVALAASLILASTAMASDYKRARLPANEKPALRDLNTYVESGFVIKVFVRGHQTHYHATSDCSMEIRGRGFLGELDACGVETTLRYLAPYGARIAWRTFDGGDQP